VALSSNSAVLIGVAGSPPPGGIIAGAGVCCLWLTILSNNIVLKFLNCLFRALRLDKQSEKEHRYHQSHHALCATAQESDLKYL
jgi:hypothetical protein